MAGKTNANIGFEELIAITKELADTLRKNSTIDYKDAANLHKYVSENGKILPRRITGTCATHQRAVTTAIKRARHMAIMPYFER